MNTTKIIICALALAAAFAAAKSQGTSSNVKPPLKVLLKAPQP